MKFSGYEYKDRKEKLEEILDNTDKVVETENFPRDEEFTYSNGYKAWASAIFVDLRNSSKLFSEYDDVKISKVIRGFTSEIIEILRKDVDKNELKEIGIRGDCVYAIYSTPTKNSVFDVADRSFYINTYMGMLNKLLSERDLPNIKAGIGLATGRTLAVKAGRNSSGINNLVWIGDSVTTASNLSDLGNRNDIGSIVMSSVFYQNILNKLKDRNPEEDVESWWEKSHTDSHGTYYHGNVIKKYFDNWITQGMPD